MAVVQVINVTRGVRYQFSSYAFMMDCFYGWGKTWRWYKPEDHYAEPFAIFGVRQGRREWALMRRRAGG